MKFAIANAIAASAIASSLFGALDEECIPSVGPPPVSCVDCSAFMEPQNVPSDLSKMWGVWHTVRSEDGITLPDRICTQLNFKALDATNMSTDVDYLAFWNDGGSAASEGSRAQGLFKATGQSSTTGQAPYQLYIPAPQFLPPGVEIPPNDFFFVASDGDEEGNDASAVVTYACPQDGRNSQMFMLSREPVLSASTEELLKTRARKAMSNFDAHSFHVVDHPAACQSPFEQKELQLAI